MTSQHKPGARSLTPSVSTEPQPGGRPVPSSATAPLGHQSPSVDERPRDTSQDMRRQGLDRSDHQEKDMGKTDDVLGAIRFYGDRVAKAGDPAAGYSDVRQAVFAFRDGRPIPGPNLSWEECGPEAERELYAAQELSALRDGLERIAAAHRGRAKRFREHGLEPEEFAIADENVAVELEHLLEAHLSPRRAA